jgi:hypothetical protein
MAFMTQNRFTLGLKVRQRLIWQEVGTFGVKDVIFRLCEEVEEGVDVANELEALKKKEMNSFSL